MYSEIHVVQCVTHDALLNDVLFLANINHGVFTFCIFAVGGMNNLFTNVQGYKPRSHEFSGTGSMCRQTRAMTFGQEHPQQDVCAEYSTPTPESRLH